MRIIDNFFDRFLKKDGETLEEAKKRLKKEQAERNKRIKKYSKSTKEIQKEIKEKYGLK